MNKLATRRLVPSQVPPAIHAQLLQIGPVVEPPATALVYAPLQQQEPYAQVQVSRGQSYGADSRNLLDVFAPVTTGAARPVLVFLHGGAFIGGDRRRQGSPFYDNIMLWAVKNGMVGVNMTYRLAPQFQWPAAQEDVAAALTWMRHNVAAFGGDPTRIVLVGHSSGAAHVAQYIAHPRFHVTTGSGVFGAVLLSGLYNIATGAANAALQSYFGVDPSLYAQRSALPGLVAAGVPLLVAYAEMDPPDFHAQGEQIHAALTAAGKRVLLLKLMGHTHMSEVYAINTADRSLSDPIAAFARSVR